MFLAFALSTSNFPNFDRRQSICEDVLLGEWHNNNKTHKRSTDFKKVSVFHLRATVKQPVGVRDKIPVFPLGW